MILVDKEFWVYCTVHKEYVCGPYLTQNEADNCMSKYKAGHPECMLVIKAKVSDKTKEK